MTSEPPPRPLRTTRIVDLSRILAGPFATQLLADLGAEVVKFEPIGGDPTRGWGPPFEQGDGGESAYFRCANRGKTSREVDLESREGGALLRAELERADVLVENFLPRSAAKLGLTFDRLKTEFPRLIVASIRSFASDTPARDRAGYDFLIQAESGWMSITGEPDGRPMKVGVALVDVLAGLYLANGIQAALIDRERTGSGRHVEVPLMEAALAGLINVGSSFLMTGKEPTRYGNAHPNIVPYQSFSCRDGDVAIAVGGDRQFAALCDCIGLGHLLEEHPEWGTNRGRVADRDRVVTTLAAAIAPRSVAEMLASCEPAGVAAGPVRSVGDALRHASELHRGVHTIAEEGDADGDGVDVKGGVEVIGTPILIDGARVISHLPPPRWTDRPVADD